MGYFADNPELHHRLLVVNRDAVWLVRDQHGVVALPSFVTASMRRGTITA